MSTPILAAGARVRWLRLIPTIFAMYTIAFFDRINFGLAVPSLIKDLHISPAEAGFAGGIFFWGYLITFLAAGWLAPRFGARNCILIALLAWGAFAIGSGFARSYNELLVMRFLLGAAEGPVWTATSMLLAQWFVQEERARAFGLWNLCIPVGALLAGPISGLILTYSTWHIMFILEGLPAWVWAAVWWRNIPNRLEDATWMAAEDRIALQNAFAAEQAGLQRPGNNWQGMLKDRNVWLLLGAFSMINMLSYGFSLWLPSAIKAASTLGIGSVGMLSALPYIAAVFGLIAVTRSSDKRGERRLHVALPMLVIGVLLWVGAYFGQHAVVIQMVAFVAMGFFLYMFLPILFTFLTELLPQEMAIPAIAFVGGVGNLFGGFVGPWLVGLIKQQTGSFLPAFTLLAVLAVIGSGCALMVRLPGERRDHLAAAPRRAQ
ncbi:MAG: MFS transporter [Rhodospirillales bacterium]|nr:MFS transporter [Rhodospirillales bacterium]